MAEELGDSDGEVAGDEAGGEDDRDTNDGDEGVAGVNAAEGRVG